MKKSLLIIALCLIAQLWLTSRLAVYGQSAADLQERITLLRKENQKLELSIASQISCSAIARKAAEAGFVPLADLSSPRADLSVAWKR